MRPHRDVHGFLAKYSPEIAERLQAARAHLATTHFPRGFELVYDNYNALVFGFSPTERAGDAVVSLAGYPKWVTLFFLKGAALPDPNGVLQGSGRRVRGVRLEPFSLLYSPAVQNLLRLAVEPCAAAFGAAPPLATVIKSVSAVQRPRRSAAVPRKSTSRPRVRKT